MGQTCDKGSNTTRSVADEGAIVNETFGRPKVAWRIAVRFATLPGDLWQIVVGWVERSEAHAVLRRRFRVGLAMLDLPDVSHCAHGPLTSTVENGLRT